MIYKIKLIFAGKFLDRSFLIKNLLSWFSIENNINADLLKKVFIKNMGFVKKILVQFPNHLDGFFSREKYGRSQ